MADSGGLRETQLRGTSDQLLLAIQTVGLLEQQKRGVPFGDARFPDLAKAVREAAQSLLDLAADEESEAARIHRTADGSTGTIVHTPPAASLAAILAEWRAVERRLTDADAGSTDAEELLRAFERLRVLYATALASEARRAGSAGPDGRKEADR